MILAEEPLWAEILGREIQDRVVKADVLAAAANPAALTLRGPDDIFFLELHKMDLWLLPTPNVLVNTFLRSLVVIAALILSGHSWYVAYWGAVVHDAISLILVYRYV